MLDNAVMLWGLLLVWAVLNTALLLFYRRMLWCLWREPVWRHPVLVVESDDWGAGPLIQAEALRDIAAVLSRHADASGRAPTFNLSLVLAVPDGPAIETGGAYGRIELDAPLFEPIVAALMNGQARGVFALQMHGMEHYWPQAVMASGDAAVQAWLRQTVPATTEHLPSPLQSRWVNAVALPSAPHAGEAIRAAVALEIQTYHRVFGAVPAVVVPPTFVWTLETERVWAEHGVECVVTPGWRYTGRDAQGLPDGDEGPILNGDRSGGLIYLVRSDYFEPARGRDAEHALRALSVAAAQGRPCLLENHRDNFITNPLVHQQSLVELDTLYREALKRHQQLRFLSSSELAARLRTHDSQWLILGLLERLPFLWRRLRQAGRLWKLMRLTGLALLGTLIVSMVGSTSSDRAANSSS